MWDREVYRLVEAELEKNHVDEAAEDVLLELAECLADQGVMGEELHCQLDYGRTVVKAWGICRPAEEELEESGPSEASPSSVEVKISRISIGGKEIGIDDYFL